MKRGDLVANRRMISKTVLYGLEFSKLSADAKILYVYLLIAADDDGFISNPVREAKAGDVDITYWDELQGSGLVIVFPNGVAVIRDWLNQNRVQSSKHTPTAFQSELKQLGVNQNSQYYVLPTDEEQESDELPTDFRQNADELPTQYSIGKVSTGKVREDKDKSGKGRIGEGRKGGMGEKKGEPTFLEDSMQADNEEGYSESTVQNQYMQKDIQEIAQYFQRQLIPQEIDSLQWALEKYGKDNLQNAIKQVYKNGGDLKDMSVKEFISFGSERE